MAGHDVRPADQRITVRIQAFDLPGRSCGPSPERPSGHGDIHVGVQRRGKPNELLGLVAADVASANWTLSAGVKQAANGTDLSGPYIQGPPGGRFIYLNWVNVDPDHSMTMFRRAKLLFDGVPGPVIGAAVELGHLVGQLGLTDEKGNPRCAAVRPPTITWSAVEK